MATGSKKNNGGDVVLESRHLVGLFVLMVAIFGVVFLLGYELGRNQYGDQVRAASAAPPEDESGIAAKASAAKPAAPPASQPAATAKTSAAPGPKDSAANVKPGAGGSPPADYDFYKLGQPNQPPAHLSPPPKTTAAKPSSKGATPTINVPGKTVSNSAPAKSQPVVTKPANSAKPQTPGMNAPLIPRGSILLQVSAMTKEVDALKLAQELQEKRFPAIVIPAGADKFYHVQVGPYANQKAADAARAALEKAGFKSIVKR